MKRWARRAVFAAETMIFRKTSAKESAALRVTSTRLLSKIGFARLRQEETERGCARRRGRAGRRGRRDRRAGC